jgi:hypothetical protein
MAYNGGRKWLMEHGRECLFGGAHDAGGNYVMQLSSGAVAAGCLHNLCSGLKWQDLRKKYEPDYDPNRRWQANGNGGPRQSDSTAQDEKHDVAKHRPWPELDPAAYHGIAGEFVRLVEPHSEADPVALLTQFLVMAGNLIGRGPYRLADGALHYSNLFMVAVGPTSAGRKGTSHSRTMQTMRLVDENWAAKCQFSGLSSGEGLIWQVRDPIEKREPVKEGGRFTGDYQTYEADAGVHDKRCLVYEPEFARTLRVCERETNILSTVVRQAWDSGDLSTLTKSSPAPATNAHISIVAHITQTEPGRGHRGPPVARRQAEIADDVDGPAIWRRLCGQERVSQP